MKKFLLLAMTVFLLVACGEKKWEYRVIQVNSELSKIRSSEVQ